MSLAAMLVCEFALSACAATSLHMAWGVPWWPQAVGFGFLAGFGAWALLVEIVWVHRRAGRAGPQGCRQDDDALDTSDGWPFWT